MFKFFIMGASMCVLIYLVFFSFDFSISEQQEQVEVVSSATFDSLQLTYEIEKAAEAINEPAENAEDDSVWRATPGYSGIEVDIEASYENMKEAGTFDKNKLVLRETSPSVHLEDLPAAPLYRGHPNKNATAFLINVAWGEEYIPDMLQTLQDNNVKATFFLDGSWVRKHPSLARMIKEEGHEIGNHAYSHPDMAQLPAQKVVQELEQTQRIIEATTNTTPTWFAPPSGSYRDEVVELADERGMRTVMWTVDTIDWQKPSPEQLTNRVLSKLHPGATVLMHPTEATSRSLERLIEGAHDEGLHVGTLSQLTSEKRLPAKR
ncbi:polysaccharide deacetylase family protein [Salsuginibacillus kocurii]|uniref:polysaccharide deacetylase family protein n=1 Tax=Salsuginibacillus kocurii TaxID=427078 RepID=UPI00037D564D|nr:polysaccharide deacetylase family protein [Salsuginibacillus kocurii]